MWRVAAVAVGCLLGGGCNELLGIHDLGDVDAAIDGTGAKDARANDARATVDAPASCYLPTSLGTPTFAAGDEGARVDPPTTSAPYTTTYWYGLAGSGVGQFELEIAAFSGGGATGSDATPDWPTSLGPKSGLDLAASSDVEVILVTDIGSDGTAQVTYFAEAGTLSLTQAGSAVGATFAGTIADAGLVHVDVDASTGLLTTDPDNCATAIPSLGFSGTVELDAPTASRSSARQPVRAARGE